MEEAEGFLVVISRLKGWRRLKVFYARLVVISRLKGWRRLKVFWWSLAG